MKVNEIIVIIDGMQFKVSPEINAKYNDGNIGKLTVTLLGISDEINKAQKLIEEQRNNQQ